MFNGMQKFLIVSGICAVAAAPSLAGHHGGDGHGANNGGKGANVDNSNNNNNNNNNGSEEIFREQRAAKQAQQDAANAEAKSQADSQAALVAARTESTKAEAEFKDVVTQLTKEFDASHEMAAALANQKSAQEAVDGLTKPLIANMASRPDYVAALKEKDAAQAKVKSLRESNGSSQMVSDAAKDAMATGTRLSAIETEAVSANPEVAAGRAKLVAATANVAQMRQKFLDTLKSNPQWIAAKQKMDDSKAALAQAQKSTVGIAQHTPAKTDTPMTPPPTHNSTSTTQPSKGLFGGTN